MNLVVGICSDGSNNKDVKTRTRAKGELKTLFKVKEVSTAMKIKTVLEPIVLYGRKTP